MRQAKLDSRNVCGNLPSAYSNMWLSHPVHSTNSLKHGLAKKWQAWTPGMHKRDQNIHTKCDAQLWSRRGFVKLGFWKRNREEKIWRRLRTQGKPCWIRPKFYLVQHSCFAR